MTIHVFPASRDMPGLIWPDTNKHNLPKPRSQQNVEMVLRITGVELFYDAFASRPMMRREGRSVPLDDAAVLDLFFEAENLGLECRKEWFTDCLVNLASRSPKNTVREKLDALIWDGKQRLDGWLVRHAEGDDTLFSIAAFTLALVASVRRVRQPGCKWDQLVVLEGPQGGGKSTFLRILAGGGEYFTDALPIGADGKETLEIAHGKLIIELGELAGIGKREVALVKQFVSRQTDRARLAYAKSAVEVPRQFTIWGTTNDNEYLADPTGNRRFWPLRVGRIDLELLRADVDQLWAEAAAIEALGHSLLLPEYLWADAAEAQRHRRMSDTWEDAISQKLEPFLGQPVKVTTLDVLLSLGVELSKQTPRKEPMRVAGILKGLGFASIQIGKARRAAWLRGDAAEARRIVCSGLNGSLKFEGQIS